MHSNGTVAGVEAVVSQEAGQHFRLSVKAKIVVVGQQASSVALSL